MEALRERYGDAGDNASVIVALGGDGFMLQMLHALTFGASHIGAMYFMARTVPPGAAASAQSLYAAVSAGLGSGFVMLAAGALYSAYSGRAYLFMALLSAAGFAGTMALARWGRR